MELDGVDFAGWTKPGDLTGRISHVCAMHPLVRLSMISKI
jgi:hypothetical protein